MLHLCTVRGLGPAIGEVIVVAFAQFVAFGPDQKEDEAFTLDRDDAFRCFTRTLADLDESRTAVVMFKVKAQGRALLELWFNDKEFDIFHEFDRSDAKSVRTFHEVVPPGRLKRAGSNELCVESGEIDGQPPGTLEISDIVVFYHGTT
jgi:hypothetical protein